MRFSILQLLTATTIIAFATFSLKRADPLFETLFFSFTLLVILAAILMAIGRKEGARAFWIAFATTSALYLVFAHIPDSDGMGPRHNGPEVTTQLLRLSYNWLHSDSYDTNFSLQPGGGFDLVQVNTRKPDFARVQGGVLHIISSGDFMSFMRIGHSAWALLVGLVAGYFTRFIYERSRLQPT